ncbi:dehydratase [Halobacteriales archaeon QS_4_69_225]|nr:MAG: dehydratase [Halobacteriales archaeon QS_4_69_225]
MTRPAEGDSYTVERTFTTEEVRRFTALSGDDQPRHTDPDADGRLLVQGLLTATLPTAVGGDLEMLAHEMDFEFRRPVYTGEPITCEWTHETVETREDRYAVTADVDCRNADGETVLSATIEGFIEADADADG